MRILLLCLTAASLNGIAIGESQYANAPESAAHHTAPTDAIAFVVITMVIGVFTLHVLSFTKIPYTAMLMVSVKKANLPPCRLFTVILLPECCCINAMLANLCSG